MTRLHVEEARRLKIETERLRKALQEIRDKVFGPHPATTLTRAEIRSICDTALGKPNDL